MRKKLFNRHKIVRKWRRLEDGIQPVLSRSHDDRKSTKDFAWHRKKINPFYHGEINWRRRAQIFVCVLCCLFMAGLGMYHPFFHITSIAVSGAERLSSHDVEEAIRGMINYRKAFIFPAKSYFLVSTSEISDILKSRFPLSGVTVTKSFPHSMSVVIEEKISTVIYDNGKEYSYLGLDGNIVEIVRKVGEDEWKYETKITTSTDEHGVVIEHKNDSPIFHIPPTKALALELGDYPVVYDTRGKSGKVNDVMLDQGHVSSVIDWFNLLKLKTDIPFGYVEIGDQSGDVVIRTGEGWGIKIKLTTDPEEQINLLLAALKSDIQRKQLQYIDLRYPGRVYWQ